MSTSPFCKDLPRENSLDTRVSPAAHDTWTLPRPLRVTLPDFFASWFPPTPSMNCQFEAPVRCEAGVRSIQPPNLQTPRRYFMVWLSQAGKHHEKYLDLALSNWYGIPAFCLQNWWQPRRSQWWMSKKGSSRYRMFFFQDVRFNFAFLVRPAPPPLEH